MLLVVCQLSHDIIGYRVCLTVTIDGLKCINEITSLNSNNHNSHRLLKDQIFQQKFQPENILKIFTSCILVTDLEPNKSYHADSVNMV